jgi:elongator complex protein 6
MSTTRIPPILEPYTRLPRAGELVLLTNVLGAGTNWLVSQFLCAALAEKPRDEGTRGSGGIGDEEKEEETAVVLVSWMRDLEFWRGEGRKAWVSFMVLIPCLRLLCQEMCNVEGLLPKR